MISIVVPARNESAVITRTLSAMLAGAAPGELDIIVVCNACTDDTAAVAHAIGPPVRVIETPTGGKTHALNLGDQAARTFPRLYVDADVVIAMPTIRALVERLDRGDILAAAPLPRLELTGCSWPVRAYYDIAQRLPAARQGFGGSGVYSLSAVGRQRFGEFPQLTADDIYVRVQFAPHERETLPHVTSTVFPPRTLDNLIAIRARSQYGNFELARRFPELMTNMGESNRAALARLVKSPQCWAKLLVYLFVTLSARRRAKRREHSQADVWARDETSRAGRVQGDSPRSK